MKKILVPTDFSSNAFKAAEYAANIAIKSDAVIYLLHVIEPVADSIRQPYPLHGKLKEEITVSRMRELKLFQQSIHQRYPGITTEMAAASGTISTCILEFAAEKEINLIVMGTRGASGLKEIFMGTVAADTITRTKIPVLAVPDEYMFEMPDAILFTTRFFEKSTYLLNALVEIATIFKAAIYVAVFIDTDMAETTDYSSNTRQLKEYIDFLMKAFPGIDFNGSLVTGKEFEETVELYNERNEVDIIAMITYPKGFWEKLLQKSVTRKMAFHSKIPVLAIPVN